MIDGHILRRQQALARRRIKARHRHDGAVLAVRPAPALHSTAVARAPATKGTAKDVEAAHDEHGVDNAQPRHVGPLALLVHVQHQHRQRAKHRHQKAGAAQHLNGFRFRRFLDLCYERSLEYLM